MRSFKSPPPPPLLGVHSYRTPILNCPTFIIGCVHVCNAACVRVAMCVCACEREESYKSTVLFHRKDESHSSDCDCAIDTQYHR